MTVEEIFSHISAHMIKGLMIHDQLSSGYGFLNLCGYKKCHEYHYFEESYNYRCLQDYYLEHYNKLIPEEKIENPNIIPANWYKYARIDVDANTKRAAVKDMMKKWVTWEQETKMLLETSYKALYDMGEISAARKIGHFLDDVNEELSWAESKHISLENTGYEIGSIIGQQKHLCKKYWEKMQCIYKLMSDEL